MRVRPLVPADIGRFVSTELQLKGLFFDGFFDASQPYKFGISAHTSGDRGRVMRIGKQVLAAPDL